MCACVHLRARVCVHNVLPRKSSSKFRFINFTQTDVKGRTHTHTHARTHTHTHTRTITYLSNDTDTRRQSSRISVIYFLPAIICNQSRRDNTNQRLYPHERDQPLSEQYIVMNLYLCQTSSNASMSCRMPKVFHDRLPYILDMQAFISVDFRHLVKEGSKEML